MRHAHREDYQPVVSARQAHHWYNITGKERYNGTIFARYPELVPGLVFYILKLRMVFKRPVIVRPLGGEATQWLKH